MKWKLKHTRKKKHCGEISQNIHTDLHQKQKNTQITFLITFSKQIEKQSRKNFKMSETYVKNKKRTYKLETEGTKTIHNSIVLI